MKILLCVTLSCRYDACARSLWINTGNIVVSIGGANYLTVESYVENRTSHGRCQKIGGEEVESTSSCGNSEYSGRFVIAVKVKKMSKCHDVHLFYYKTKKNLVLMTTDKQISSCWDLRAINLQKNKKNQPGFLIEENGFKHDSLADWNWSSSQHVWLKCHRLCRKKHRTRYG